jgi:alpha-1,6-mannosyltransferase
MLANGVGGLHNDLLMVGLMAAALVVAAERGWQWAAVLGGTAAAVKLPGGLVCVAVVLVSLPVAASLAERVRRLAAVGSLALGTLWGLGAVWGLGAGWVAALTVGGGGNTPLSMPTVVGQFLDRAVGLLGIGIGIGETFFLDSIRALASLASVAIVAWVALRWRTGERNESVRAVVVIISVMLLLSPVVHLWYFLWLVPFAAPMRMSRLGTTLVVAVSLIGGAVAPLDPSLRGAYLTIVVGSLCAAVMVAILLFTKRSRERLERIAESDWLPVP